MALRQHVLFSSSVSTPSPASLAISSILFCTSRKFGGSFQNSFGGSYNIIDRKVKPARSCFVTIFLSSSVSLEATPSRPIQVNARCLDSSMAMCFSASVKAGCVECLLISLKSVEAHLSPSMKEEKIMGQECLM